MRKEFDYYTSIRPNFLLGIPSVYVAEILMIGYIGEGEDTLNKLVEALSDQYRSISINLFG